MRKVLWFFVWLVVGLVVIGAAFAGYFLYTPDPEMPQLSGHLAEGSIESDGRVRTYLTYVPQGVAPGAPLVIAMHGSGGSARQMRGATGFGFERLADQHKFVVVYPNGFEGYWNACNVVGEYSANTLNIDDVAFLTALVDKLAGEAGINRERVFAMGLSRGGHMAFRLALEAPARFRAVTAVAANVPAPENFKCKPAGATSSVMIMNGTADPLNPFDGGEVRLYGFIGRGTVLSSRASAEYFVTLNAIASEPQSTSTPVADGFRVVRSVWRNDSPVEVELVAIQGGGHVIPQPAYRYPRILGPTPTEPNGPEVMWDFFARQR
jgi:polyhydroxybutyrate depolymerase